jgi:hypothetical protein
MGCGCSKNKGGMASKIRDVVLVTEEEFKRKIDICKSCDKLSSKHMRCKECGCFLRLKARLKGFGCPLDKW